MVIKLNSKLAHPMFFRVAAVDGVSLEISSAIDGFVIEQEGEDTIVGTDKAELHRILREVIRGS